MSFQQDPQQHMPSSIEELLAKAITCHKVGQLSEAESLYQKIIGQAPQHGAALYRLSMLYIQGEKACEALPLLEQVLKAQPQNPGVLNSMGVALQILGRGPEAINHFQKALVINPNDMGTLGNLGKAFRDQNRIKEALDCFQEILRPNPNNPRVKIEIGRCHYEMSAFDKAATCFEEVLKEQPDYVEALSGLGITLSAAGRLEDARLKFERALRLEPNDTKTIINYGEFLYDEGKIEEALTYFEKALSLDQKDDIALWRKSFALLAKGNYKEGWKLYANSFGCPETRGLNIFAPQKAWDGSPAPDKHLLIWCEQGFGDSMQFIRYAELCKKRVGKVSVFCQTPLVDLFKSIPSIDHVFDKCDRNDFDEHVPIMNLPHLFDTAIETIPGARPYLHVDAKRKAYWKSKIKKNDDLKAGLVWACGSHKNLVADTISAYQRSIKLEALKPWFDQKGVQFYSLQKDQSSEQRTSLGLRDRLIDFMGEVTDFADTAAIIMNLDLVITVDTSVAHLAGALGKPVWVLSRYNADWRWLQNRPQNPWYPTARIFGQSRMNDWSDVIAKVQHELKQIKN